MKYSQKSIFVSIFSGKAKTHFYFHFSFFFPPAIEQAEKSNAKKHIC